MANDIFYADGIAAVQLTHGNLRIHLVRHGAEEGQTVPAGTLIIPAVRAQAVLGTLNQSMGRIVEEVRKRREAAKAAGESGEADDLQYDA